MFVVLLVMAPPSQELEPPANSGRFTEGDVFDVEELATDPEHIEFLNPRGLGLSAGTFIPMPTGEVVVYSVERAVHLPSMSRDEIGVLDCYRPHLARAGAIAARIGMERAKTAAEVFELIGLPAAALNLAGRVVAANDLFQNLIPELFQDRSSRLTLTHSAADKLLELALSASTRYHDVTSIPVAAQGLNPPFVIHLLAIEKRAQDVFSNVEWMCVAMPVVPSQVPGAEVLQGLFDLTPAEARVAGAIASATSIDALARSLGVSRETIRSQLRVVLAKTGLSRQGELTALLSGKAFYQC